jgi:hypothetical protein
VPIVPNGKTLPECMMRQKDGKQLVYHVCLSRCSPVKAIVLADSNDRQALSVAMGLADGLELDRSIIFQPGAEDAEPPKEPPNRHVYEMTRESRNSVAA